MFTFQCTRCRKKPAIVTRGRKVFLCADCATGSLWYDMVGSLMEEGTLLAPDSETEGHEGMGAERSDTPIDPWQVAER